MRPLTYRLVVLCSGSSTYISPLEQQQILKVCGRAGEVVANPTVTLGIWLYQFFVSNQLIPDPLARMMVIERARNWLDNTSWHIANAIEASKGNWKAIFATLAGTVEDPWKKMTDTQYHLTMVNQSSVFWDHKIGWLSLKDGTTSQSLSGPPLTVLSINMVELVRRNKERCDKIAATLMEEQPHAPDDATPPAAPAPVDVP